MATRILIVGGTGRIGSAVARDLLAHTDVQVIVTGRNAPHGEAVAATLGSRASFTRFDLDRAQRTPGGVELRNLLRGIDVAVQCAGPFRPRSPSLLEACIAAGIHYVDVCDDRGATQSRLALDAAARAAGITALIDTGTFPGIDSVMAADVLARRPDADAVRLSFFCAGSGGGGFGVLQTTFLAVSGPYAELHAGRWRLVPSYRTRGNVDFGAALGRRTVYSFEVPEVWSLARTFPRLRTVTSQFGTSPALWNWATAALAAAPKRLRTDAAFLDRSATFILPAVHRIDRRVGEALGIRVDVQDAEGSGEAALFYAPSTTEAVGWATGIATAMVARGEIASAGVLLPEVHVPPAPYLDRLAGRGGVFTRMELDAWPSRPVAADARSLGD